jgi:glycosyltransferase involved in cell wall biosynthesis
MSRVPVVSVITPVYNGARYLAECIRSVCGQTYRDWEYVVLDNVSTDDTPRIAEEAASGDSRVRVVRANEFLSVWGNHNRAIRAITPGTRYLKIVHADDWLYPECLEHMVAVADRSPTVGVVSAFRLEGDWVLHDGLLPYTQPVMTGREVIRRAILGPPWVTGSPSSVMFRADLARADASFFDESVWHADTDAVYRVLTGSDLGFVHQVLSFTRIHPGALTSFSYRANTFLPQALRMIIRYGRKVLSPKEYRTSFRRCLRIYLWFLAKQAIKPSRWRDERFHDFHRREIRYMLREVGGDREARLGLRFCRRLLKPSREKGDEKVEGPATALELSRYVHLQPDRVSRQDRTGHRV